VKEGAMIYTLTMWLCLATQVCIPVKIEGTVLYARSPQEARLVLAGPLARRADVAAARLTSCVVGRDA
jgi:hypothetical protein